MTALAAPALAPPGPCSWDGAALDAVAATHPDAVLARRGDRGQATAVVAAARIPEVLRALRDAHGFTLLTDLAGWDRLELLESPPFPCGHGERFEVVYHLYAPGRGARVRVVAPANEDDPAVPTATALWPAANWLERECFDQYGVRFPGHPNLKRILNHHQFQGHPLRRDFPLRRRFTCTEPDPLTDELRRPRPDRWGGTGADARGLDAPAAPAAGPDVLDDDPAGYTTVNLGPSHPASHGTLRVLLKLDGETIVRAVPEIGYLHRGFEKSCEKGTWTEAIPYTDRLNYNSALANNVAYCRAVEAMLGIEVPPRCRMLRVMGTEMARIMDHLIAVGTNLVDIGALTNFWWFFNERERFYRIVEKLCGARLTTSWTRIGGLNRDAYEGFTAEVQAACDALLSSIDDVRTLVERNRIFHDRTADVGAIGPEEALAYGFTGPCLRATGVALDLRRAHPYDGYDELDFDVPVGAAGDTRDRILVRFAEMAESARILRQCCDKLPAGPIQHDDWKVVLPPKERVYGSIEGLMGHFNLVMHGIKVPAGESYHAIEAANGELGFYLVSDGSGRPHRARVRPPCFSIYSAFARLIEGQLVADAIAVLGSLNVIAGELDR